MNTLFPASLGYTANGLEGGASDAALVQTGNLDLRLAAIETVAGGDISILGPGGRVLAGSVVSTAAQAARRNYDGYGLSSPEHDGRSSSNGRVYIASTLDIPPGYEGVITQNGGAINTFTDGDFLLNQSRLFTVNGGDITMWSSNADLNAGQGAKTTPNFPPIAVSIGKNGTVTIDQAGATTGAGIAALPPEVGVDAPNVYLLAPRGAVDAGDAGVRVAGNLSVAALVVLNADNIKVGGTVTGIPVVQAPNVSVALSTSSATAATQHTVAPNQGSGNDRPSVIIVEVLGYGGGNDDPDRKRREEQQRSSVEQPAYNPNSSVNLIGNGALTQEQKQQLTDRERENFGRLGL